jgi:hypothetical protein
MIRYAHEKSNGTYYIIWMDMLNSFINDTTIIEMIRGVVDLPRLINKKI